MTCGFMLSGPDHVGQGKARLASKWSIQWSAAWIEHQTKRLGKRRNVIIGASVQKGPIQQAEKKEKNGMNFFSHTVLLTTPRFVNCKLATGQLTSRTLFCFSWIFSFCCWVSLEIFRLLFYQDFIRFSFFFQLLVFNWKYISYEKWVAMGQKNLKG